MVSTVVELEGFDQMFRITAWKRASKRSYVGNVNWSFVIFPFCQRPDIRSRLATISENNQRSRSRHTEITPDSRIIPFTCNLVMPMVWPSSLPRCTRSTPRDLGLIPIVFTPSPYFHELYDLLNTSVLNDFVAICYSK